MNDYQIEVIRKGPQGTGNIQRYNKQCTLQEAMADCITLKAQAMVRSVRLYLLAAEF